MSFMAVQSYLITEIGPKILKLSHMSKLNHILAWNIFEFDLPAPAVLTSLWWKGKVGIWGIAYHNKNHNNNHNNMIFTLKHIILALNS